MITSIITSILLGLAVLLVVICAIGVVAMRDPLQRLHYLAPPATISISLFVIAVFVDEHDWQARLKILFILILLSLLNGVVTHATARAVVVRERANQGSS